MADTVGNGDVTAVSDGVGALDGFPSGVLLASMDAFLGGMPSDGGRVKKDFGPLERGQAGGFGVPLVPADQHADFSVASAPGPKSQVSWREIELLIIQR